MRHQRVEVGFAAVQQHVGLAAHDAGGRTRRVQQHRVERRAVPPGRGCRRRRRRAASRSRQTPGARAFRRTRSQALRVDVEREQAQRRIAFEQVRGLAAGRGAGIEHARARRRRQRIGDAVARRRPAREHAPSAKPGSALPATGVVQAQRIGGRSVGHRAPRCRRRAGARGTPRACHARRLTRSHIGGGGRAGVRGCVGVARGQSRCTRSRSQSRPVRMRVAAAGNAFALGAPQQRVDHAGLVRAAQRARGFDRRGDRRMRGQAQRSSCARPT